MASSGMTPHCILDRKYLPGQIVPLLLQHVDLRFEFCDLCGVLGGDTRLFLPRALLGLGFGEPGARLFELGAGFRERLPGRAELRRSGARFLAPLRGRRVDLPLPFRKVLLVTLYLLLEEIALRGPLAAHLVQLAAESRASSFCPAAILPAAASSAGSEAKLPAPGHPWRRPGSVPAAAAARRSAFRTSVPSRPARREACWSHAPAAA